MADSVAHSFPPDPAPTEKQRRQKKAVKTLNAKASQLEAAGGDPIARQASLSGGDVNWRQSLRNKPKWKMRSKGARKSMAIKNAMIATSPRSGGGGGGSGGKGAKANQVMPMSQQEQQAAHSPSPANSPPSSPSRADEERAGAIKVLKKQRRDNAGDTAAAAAEGGASTGAGSGAGASAGTGGRRGSGPMIEELEDLDDLDINDPDL